MSKGEIACLIAFFGGSFLTTGIFGIVWRDKGSGYDYYTPSPIRGSVYCTVAGVLFLAFAAWWNYA